MRIGVAKFALKSSIEYEKNIKLILQVEWNSQVIDEYLIS